MFTIPQKETVWIYGPKMINVEAEPVFDDEYHLLPALRAFMVRVMEKHNGIGLAAPQVGVFKQFFILRKDEGDIVDVVNPEVSGMWGQERPGFEACLSLPPVGNGCRVSRCDHISLEHSTAESDHRIETTFSYMDSRVAQHENDHLVGTFFLDRVHETKQKDILREFNKWKENLYAEKQA